MSRIYANKTDANHAAIRDELRVVLHDGVIHDCRSGHNGFPDLCIGWKGFNFLYEIKKKGGSRLTNSQVSFHQNWQGQAAVCRSATEVLADMLREVHSRK